MSSPTGQASILGFIGLGQMGRPMVSNLLHDGYRVRVFNRTPEKAQPLVAEGAELVDRVEDVAEPGGIVMSCVADDRALDEAVGSHPELFARLGPEGIHVSMSTILPETARRLAQQHAAQGGIYVAAPVMGRPDAVAASNQFYLIAGPEPAVARVTPILQAISRAVYPFGDDAGAANVAKLAMNFLIASSMEAMAEAFTVARKNGLDPARLHSMFSETMFACPIYKNYGAMLLQGQFDEPLFRLVLGLKDMGLVSQMAFTSRTPMPLASLLRDRYLSAAARGRGEWDWMAIAADIASAAGL